MGTCRYHRNTVLALAAAEFEEERFLFAASADETVSIWKLPLSNVEQPLPFHVLRDHTEMVRCLAVGKSPPTLGVCDGRGALVLHHASFRILTTDITCEHAALAVACPLWLTERRLSGCVSGQRWSAGGWSCATP
jgi:hypothetical protein